MSKRSFNTPAGFADLGAGSYRVWTGIRLDMNQPLAKIPLRKFQRDSGIVNQN